MELKSFKLTSNHYTNLEKKTVLLQYKEKRNMVGNLQFDLKDELVNELCVH